MRFLARLYNLLLDEAQDVIRVLDFKSLKKTEHITILSIHDFDSICKTLNQNTKPSPTKEISLVDNLAQWLCGLKYFVKLKSLSKYGCPETPRYWLTTRLTRSSIGIRHTLHIFQTSLLNCAHNVNCKICSTLNLQKCYLLRAE